MKVLERKLREGKDKNISYSIYNTNELDTLYDKYEIDVVQLPMNILDRRFEISGWGEKRLRNDHKQIHARSVFLQGLLMNGKIDQNISQSGMVYGMNGMNIC